MALSVSVIIPVFNGGEKFRACVQSVVQAVPGPAELIVVADGDTDGSRALARAHGATVLVRPTPGGPAQARNLGAQAARGDILFFVDADVTIPPDAIAQVAAAFHDQPELAALIGSYDAAPAEPNFLSQYKNLLHHYVHQTGHEQASTFWGACGAIRRDVFLQHGGFDERYRTPCIEDIELGYRLIGSGHTIRLHKSLQVKHLKRWGVRSLLHTDFFQRAVPWTELILRERRMTNDLNLQHTQRISMLCVYGLLGTFGAVLARLLAWRKAVALAGLLLAPLMLSNAALYRFFWRRHGGWFTLGAVFWHWLYYFYSGIALGVGGLRFLRALVRGRTHRVAGQAAKQSNST